MIAIGHLINKKIILTLMLASILFCLGFHTNIIRYPVSFLFTLSGVSIYFYFLYISPTLQKKIFFMTIFYFFMYIFSLTWVGYAIKDFSKISAFIAYPLGFFVSIICLPQLFFAPFIIELIQLLKKRFKILENPFFDSISFTLFDTLMPYFFTVHVGYSWLSHPSLVLNADLFGVSYYSWFIYFCACLIVQLKLKKMNKQVFQIYLSIVILSFFLGVILKLGFNNFIAQSTPRDSIKVKVLQPMDLEEVENYKESKGQEVIQKVYNNLINLSKKSANEFHEKKEVEIIIWPETAYPHRMIGDKNTYLENDSTLKSIFQTIQESYSEPPEFFIGSYTPITNKMKKTRSFDPNQEEFNSAIFFDQDLKVQNIYNKMILLPFGEELPLGLANFDFMTKTFNTSNFARGESYPGFTTKNKHRFITSICYEILFKSHFRNYLNAQTKKPHLLINVTSDGWFGKTVELNQHLFLSRWRSLEYKIPVVRATQTGISAITNHKGEVVKNIGIYEKKSMIHDLKLYNSPKTFYQKYGILPYIVYMILLFFLSTVLLNLFKNKK